MSDFSDRLVGPLGEGGAGLVPLDDDNDLTVRTTDDAPVLDAEGNPVEELEAQRPDEIAQRSATVRQLAVDERVWRFGHVIVDEAQDLTPMQWRMVVRRTSNGSVTMLGDLAQRSTGNPGTWDDHVPPEFSLFEQLNLTTNYRSPAEINEVADGILAELAPGLPSSQAVRRSGHPPEVIEVGSICDELAPIVEEVAERDGTDDGRRPPAVIGVELPELKIGRPLTPWQAKGLEFDAVVVVEPARFLVEPNGLSLLYVALTRATDRLIVVHQAPLPELLVRAGLVDGGRR